MSILRRFIASLSCVALLSVIPGCATFNNPFVKHLPKASAADPVVQILGLWQPGEGHDPDGVPCKGFTGQILFLSSRAATPVEVDGEVRIYLFDDQGTEEEQAKPLRIFSFDSGAWAVHLAETPLGPTYTVFVPYVRRGVKDANCALRIRLKTKYSGPVFSNMSNLPLMGPNSLKKPLTGDDAKPISEEDAQDFVTEGLMNRLHRTTTISLGPNSKTTETKTAAKSDANKGEVRTASHEVVANASKESDADRIRELESMVQQLTELKKAPKLLPTMPDSTNRDAEKSVIADSGNQKESSNDSTCETVRQNDRRESRRIVPRKRVHPLDDDSPSSDSTNEVEAKRAPVRENPFE